MSTPMAPECQICLQEFNHGRQMPLVGRCGHSFCASCCPHFKGKCPVCRRRSAFKNAPPNFCLLDVIEKKEEEEQDKNEEVVPTSDEEPLQDFDDIVHLLEEEYDYDYEEEEEDGDEEDIEEAEDGPFMAAFRQLLDQRDQQIARLREELSGRPPQPAPQPHIPRPVHRNFMIPAHPHFVTPMVPQPTHNGFMFRGTFYPVYNSPNFIPQSVPYGNQQWM